MSCTNDHFILEADIPSVFLSFHVASDVIRGSFEKHETVEVNYKRLFRRSTGRKRSTIVDQKQQSSTNETLENENYHLSGLKPLNRSTNRFDTLIDRLERKYLALSNVQSSVEMVLGSEGEESMSSSQLSSSNQGSPDIKQTKTVGGERRVKKKAVVQDYDYSDPFIDDSEVVNDLEEAMHTKKLKTKHDGFFVSSGKLEVVKMKKSLNPTKPSTPVSSLMPSLNSTNVANPVNQSTTAQSSYVTVKAPSTVVLSQAPESSRTGKSTKSTKPNTMTTADNSTLQLPLPQSSVSVNDEDLPMMDALDSNSAAKPKKEKVEKPVWNPHPDVVTALEKFKEVVAEVYANSFSKNLIFPPLLEEPLVQLDAVVKQHHDEKELARTSGYYEALQSFIGRGYTASKIKTIINRLQIRRKAKAAKSKLDLAISLLQEQLKTVVIDCPPDKQPSNKKQRKPKESGVNPIPAEKAGESGEGLNESSDVHNFSIISETAVDNGLSTESIDKEDEEKRDISLDEHGVGDKKLVEYKFFCAWNLSLRQQLLQVEVLLDEWVVQENYYREKLFAADRKYLHSSEYKTLVAVDEFTVILQRICEIFPESTLQGDVSSLRKQLRTEKSRLKPKPPQSDKNKASKPLLPDKEKAGVTPIDTPENTNGNS